MPKLWKKVRKAHENKEPFMIFDEVHPTNGKRYVAFGSKVGLEMLEKSSLLLSDGTFSVAQPPFVQL
ncbi:Protein CBG27611 [Caenorhabditis briggsae]|uniref:Protein CBG27611 n=1 Tax=Caenorhabditis briggsae TaxID=6238 RepID=B6IJ56_CAEBR|nr:Protein CBG27611 [Caenorhabditis briggsae]CAR99890.1 Protein CBG27611 [Caenorhabditis briggsae]